MGNSIHTCAKSWGTALHPLGHAGFRKSGRCGMGLQYSVDWKKGTPSKGANIQVPVYWCPMPPDNVDKRSREGSGWQCITELGTGAVFPEG